MTTASTEEPLHKLNLTSTRKLEGAWDVPHPEGYSVQMEEPLVKFGEISLIPPELWIIVIVLKESSILDWIVSKNCDAALAFFKSAASGFTRKANTKLTVRAPDGHEITLEIDRSDLTRIEEIRTELMVQGSKRGSSASIKFK